MLASIHPLGERARNRRWGVTALAYASGSGAAAALLGSMLGLVGGWLPLSGRTVVATAAALCLLAVAFDLGLGGLRLPTVHRQVDESWLARYRGGVCGLGFGFQLGLGVVTIVTTATVYVTLAIAFLSGSVASGALIGATFGLVRAAPLLAVARVRRPEHLRAVHRRFQAWAPLSHRLAVGAQAVVAVALVGGFAIR